jgi:hypothetical protein
MSVTLRRLILWTIICSVSAAPSFILASSEFNRAAMVVGVLIFIALYTIGTSTEAFARFHRRPFVRRTLYMGYGLRLALSMLLPLGFVNGNRMGGAVVVLFADVFPGLLSLRCIETIGLEPKSFAGTLATTIVQGALLNAIIFAVMAVLYAFQRVFMTPPPEYAAKGFDVVMAAPPPSSLRG